MHNSCKKILQNCPIAPSSMQQLPFGPTLEPKVTKNVAKMYPDGVQGTPRSHKATKRAQSSPPRVAKELPRHPEDPQETPRGTQKSSEMMPGVPKRPPKRTVRNARGSSVNTSQR